MQQSTVKLFGGICVVVGGVCIPFAVFAYLWEETWFGWFPTYPYRDYTFPLLFIAVVLIIVGLVTIQYGEKEEEKHQVPT